MLVIEHLEETFSGSGTCDRVNGIGIQRGFVGRLPKVIMLKLNDQKNLAQKFQWTKVIYTKLVVRPMLPNLFNIKAIEITGGQAINNKNLLWVLAKMQHKTKQIISSWTGFSLILRYKQSVQYLPIINALATSMAIIHEMLCEAMQIKLY